MKKLNNRLVNTEFSGIAKVIKSADSIGDSVIHLEVGDIDLETSPAVLDGIHNALANKKLHYPELRGNRELLKMIVEKLSVEGIQISQDQLLVTAGGSMGMYIAFQTIANPGDEILIFEPVWPHLVQMITLSGATPIRIALSEETDFHGKRHRT